MVQWPWTVMPSEWPLGAAADFADGGALACPDFDPVLCACARLDPARTKTIADTVTKAIIHLPPPKMFPLLFLSLISPLLHEFGSHAPFAV
jgi:hypothetical protein